MDTQIISYGSLCLIIFSLALIPAASAIVDYLEVPVSQDPLERNRPENIAALKNHIAYIAGSQEARMNWVISYISTISGDADNGRLREIRSDYLAAAATIPAMKTADQINDLRNDMCVQSGHFAEETQARMLRFNGSSKALQEKITLSLDAFDISLNSRTDPPWLSQTDARLTLFSRESNERNFTTRSLSERGIPVTQAEQYSERIESLRPKLETALLEKNVEAILSINTEIKSLNQQFRNTIAEYHAAQRVVDQAAINSEF